MLVYEKVRKQPITIEKVQLQKTPTAFVVTEADGEVANILDYRGYIREELQQEV
ncbi:MAG: hypothetical protein JST59_00480 [Actinobacteria bacterium]|nr:hypothetical protein [Actinomycetota bacterium]